MKKFLMTAGAALLALPAMSMAQGVEVVTTTGVAGVSVGTGLTVIGAGIAVFGAAKGIGQIGGSALEGIARQPEASGKIFTPMIVAAALIEGAALFAVVVAFLKA